MHKHHSPAQGHHVPAQNARVTGHAYMVHTCPGQVHTIPTYFAVYYIQQHAARTPPAADSEHKPCPCSTDMPAAEHTLSIHT